MVVAVHLLFFLDEIPSPFHLLSLVSHISSESLIYQRISGIIATQNGENVSRFFSDNLLNSDKESCRKNSRLHSLVDYQKKHYHNLTLLRYDLRRDCKASADALAGKLSDYAVRCDAVNVVGTLPRMIWTEFGVGHQRAVCISHFTYPRFLLCHAAVLIRF